MKRVCVNMIVKNESKIIERCLRALTPHVDCYAICDTGSSDDTPAIIERVMNECGVRGKVFHTTFRNFEQARNEALDAARGLSEPYDYILFCDADMELVVTDPDYRKKLSEPVYQLIQQHVGGTLEYQNTRLVQRRLPGRYKGVTHEHFDTGTQGVLLKGLHYLDHAAGANRIEKYERDIRLLLQGIQDEPDNSRYVFYLANSYFESKQLDEAHPWYQRRIDMGGWAEEQFYSGYRIAQILQMQGKEAEFEHQVLSLHETYPHRAEPLHILALHYQRSRRHRLAYLMAQAGANLLQPPGALFVEPQVYQWRLKDIMGVSLYWTGQYVRGLEINQSILPLVPPQERQRIQDNIDWCIKGIYGQVSPPSPTPAAPNNGPTRTIWDLEAAKSSHVHSPSLARLLLDVFPKDDGVIDLGCGRGSYAAFLRDHGYQVHAVEGTLGIEAIADFKPIINFDLSKPLTLELPLSSVMSLEVGEHLFPSQEDTFLDNVCRLCKGKLVLSWAIPGQGGRGHHNERPNDHIVAQLARRGFDLDKDQTHYLRENYDRSEAWWLYSTLMVFDRRQT